VQVAVCDLRTAQVSAGYAVEMLSPVARYLADWPGAGVAVVCPAYSEIRSALRSMTRPHTLVLSESADDGMDQLHSRLPPLQRTELHLAAQLTSPRASRLFVTRALLDWHLTSLVAKASLVVSELVTNAVIHARSACSVRLTWRDDAVRVDVSDDGDGSPDPQLASEYDEEGRGLFLISAMSTAWGVEPADGGGKSIWAELLGEPVGS